MTQDKQEFLQQCSEMYDDINFMATDFHGRDKKLVGLSVCMMYVKSNGYCHPFSATNIRSTDETPDDQVEFAKKQCERMFAEVLTKGFNYRDDFDIPRQ
jgi:hypothetical protein